MKVKLFTLLSVFATSLAFAQSKTLPYTTGFDSPAEKAGWQEYRTKVHSFEHWDYGSGFSGAGISHDYQVSGGATDTVADWFVSPPLKLTSQSKMTLKLQTQGFSTPFPDNLQVLYCSKKQNPSLGNFTVIANLSFMQPQYTWLDTTVTISFTSDSGYVAFRYKTIGAAWSTYAIDNISISALPVSIKENKDSESKITIFPNPFNSNCSIWLSNELANSSPKAQLFDMYGKLIQADFTWQDQTLRLNRGNLNNGIYFITLTINDKAVLTKRLIIID